MPHSIKKILSIDDSKAVHAFLERALEKFPYALLHAIQGEKGLELLRQEKDCICLVLLDWEMPEKTGPEVLTEMRQCGIHVPVIMLTSKNNPEDIQKMLELGACEYIMKPFTPDILIEKIKTILEVE